MCLVTSKYTVVILVTALPGWPCEYNSVGSCLHPYALKAKKELNAQSSYTGELRTGTRVGRAKFMQCLE